MRRNAAIYSAVLLTACTQQPPAPIPVAVKNWSINEQIEIAKERNILAGGHYSCTANSGQPVIFPISPAVFEDWERMRRALRGQ